MTAYKQLSIALEFYLSNADKVPLPYPQKIGMPSNFLFWFNKLIYLIVPLFKQQLSNIYTISHILNDQFDQEKFIMTTKNLATGTNNICNIFLEHRYLKISFYLENTNLNNSIDFEDDEVLWTNLLSVINGARHFSIQILIASACVSTKNKVCH